MVERFKYFLTYWADYRDSRIPAGRGIIIGLILRNLLQILEDLLIYRLGG